MCLSYVKWDIVINLGQHEVLKGVIECITEPFL